MSPARIAFAVALVAAVVFAGTRLVATSAEPAGAGAASPREILATHPLDGSAFADLARAETDPAKRLALHRIAARRAPRDLEVRAWLFEHHLAAGEPAAAMEHLDVILRLAPSEMREALMPAVVQLSGDPALAGRVVEALSRGPRWRRDVLDAMRKEPDAPGSALVLAGLRERGDLSDAEAGRWFDALIQQDLWGRAFSLWASELELAPGESLPMFWNGDFERDPAPYGFDWRIGNAPGSYVQIEPKAGMSGKSARIVFLGRPVEGANLEHPLHLPPGSYRVGMVVEAEALRSGQGLAWEIVCSSRGPRFPGEPINGTFERRVYTLRFDIPVTGCPGQWLRLRNPAPAGAARIVSGELWVDDVTLEAVR